MHGNIPKTFSFGVFSKNIALFNHLIPLEDFKKLHFQQAGCLQELS